LVWLSKHDAPFLNGFKIYFLSFRHNIKSHNTTKMAKNAWMLHLQAFRKAHPGMSVPDAAKGAKKTYKSKQHGGDAMGGALSPVPVSGMDGPDSGAGIQIMAAQFSGGKKSKRSGSHNRSGSKRSGSKRSGSKRSGSKRSGSKRSGSHKRRSHKRRH
jgi:hypothetical protein